MHSGMVLIISLLSRTVFFIITQLEAITKGNHSRDVDFSIDLDNDHHKCHAVQHKHMNSINQWSLRIQCNRYKLL